MQGILIVNVSSKSLSEVSYTHIANIVIPEDTILGIDFWLPVHDYVLDLAGDTLG